MSAYKIYQYAAFILIEIDDVLATAAAFVATTANQVSL